jgi:histidine triad (HIT) family protein
MDCVFCKIINGEIPSYKVYEDDIVVAFLDINPFSTGHTLIVPKVHTLDLETIDDETLNHIMMVARKIAKDITRKLDAPGYTLIQNNGFVEEVKHFHLHVIPKYKKDKKMDIKDVYEKITQSE